MKAFVLFILLFVLTGCSNKKINNEIALADSVIVYGYSIASKEIEKIEIDYKLENVYDSFNLYTIYQNVLPIGYTSMGTCNVELIEVKIEDNICYYYVDKYISLTEDLEIFSKLLSKTNSLLGYNETKIIYNEEIIA